MKTYVVFLILSCLATSMPALALNNGSRAEDLRLTAVREVVIRPNAEDRAVASCTGTFITKKHFLTAAHCFLVLKPNVLFGGVAIGAPFQAVNLHIWNPINTPFKVFINPSFGGSVISHEAADLAIIEFTFDVSTIAMPVASENARRGDRVVLSGYGCDKAEKTETSVFKVGAAQIQDLTDVRVKLAKSKITLCHGDSGGPLLRQRVDGSYEVVGVNSYFNPVSKILGNSFDRVARVDAGATDAVVDWIKTVTSGKSTQKPVVTQGF